MHQLVVFFDGRSPQSHIRRKVETSDKDAHAELPMPESAEADTTSPVRDRPGRHDCGADVAYAGCLCDHRHPCRQD